MSEIKVHVSKLKGLPKGFHFVEIHQLGSKYNIPCILLEVNSSCGEDEMVHYYYAEENEPEIGKDGEYESYQCMPTCYSNNEVLVDSKEFNKYIGEVTNKER